MNDNTDSLHDQPGSPWTQKGFIASAVVVGLLIILGAALVFTRPSDGDDRADPGPQPTTSTPSPTATRSASTPTTDSACGLPAGDQAIPVTAPPKTKWELVGTIAVPSAPETPLRPTAPARSRTACAAASRGHPPAPSMRLPIWLRARLSLNCASRSCECLALRDQSATERSSCWPATTHPPRRACRSPVSPF